MDQNPVSTNSVASQAPTTQSPKSTTAKPAADLLTSQPGELTALPEIATNIVSKINDAQNVLVALSSDPSVDEMAAAIGLSLYLDKLGKRATAIYSGTTPNALEFLKPGETFESTADTLQDFVIALNKDKADHLRYKLDGDFVKIFITPYRTRISQEDLNFSYGDFNVDLVLALDVANGADLDSALREHGRIMHDAVIVNITTGDPGKLGEIEWSDQSASSVSEMIARLAYAIAEGKVEKDEATAFLTGIVAATERFSNAKTTPETMLIASHLMSSGANQQLVAKNITPEVSNEPQAESSSAEATPENATSETEPSTESTAESATTPSDASATSDPDVAAESETEQPEDTTKLEVEHAKPSIAEPEAATPESTITPVADGDAPTAEPQPESQPEPEPSTPLETSSILPSEPPISPEESSALLEDIKATEASFIKTGSEKVLQPTTDLSEDALKEGTEKYSEMLTEAIAEPTPESNPNLPPVVTVPTAPSEVSPAAPTTPPAPKTISPAPAAPTNPALAAAPPVAANPEINGVPEINYTPATGDILPPPPMPPINFDASSLTPPAAPTTPPAPETTSPTTTNPTPITPASPTEPTPAADPSAFKIPGM